MIICKTKYNAHTDPLFKDLKIFKVTDLFHTNCLKVFHNHTNKKVPQYISSLFQSPTHSYNTRYNGLALPIMNTTASSKRLRCWIPRFMNSFPALITEKVFSHSLKGFTNYFKIHKINDYSSTCSKANCYICRGSLR